MDRDLIEVDRDLIDVERDLIEVLLHLDELKGRCTTSGGAAAGAAESAAAQAIEEPRKNPSVARRDPTAREGACALLTTRLLFLRSCVPERRAGKQ